MGVFGAGLYSGDFALDLRSTVGAVLRLPFDPDKLVDLLSRTRPSAANNPNDEEHTTFWLVLADQFAERTVACDRVRSKALDIWTTVTGIVLLITQGDHGYVLEGSGDLGCVAWVMDGATFFAVARP